jgi:hypothetical protein
VSVSAHSAGAYTATLLVMVNVMKRGGRAPPPSPAWANFTKGWCTVCKGGVYGFERMVCGFVDHCRALRIEFLAWPNSLNASGVPAAFKIKIN